MISAQINKNLDILVCLYTLLTRLSEVPLDIPENLDVIKLGIHIWYNVIMHVGAYHESNDSTIISLPFLINVF